jgi:hypothetical protein
MIVSKTLKVTTLLIAMVGILPTLASYRITIPLEISQGGALPNGSIVIGNVTNPDNGTPPPASTNCLYDENNLVVVFKRGNSVYNAGDEMYGYNQTIIGFNIPSRGFTVPSGLSKGARKDDGSNTDAMMYEICSDNFSSYPSLPPLSGPGPEEPSNNCIYDDKNYVIRIDEAQPDRFYSKGDLIFVADERVISYYSPANNKTPKPGLSKGQKIETYGDESYFEICANDLSIYPITGGVDQEEMPPEEDTHGPDYTPECLPLDTTNNYVAYDRVADQYEYNSTTYGIDHVRVNWVYKPADYDEDRPGSYQYLPEESDTVSGPNPNYDYNAICRVKKRLE